MKAPGEEESPSIDKLKRLSSIAWNNIRRHLDGLQLLARAGDDLPAVLARLPPDSRLEACRLICATLHMVVGDLLTLEEIENQSRKAAEPEPS